MLRAVISPSGGLLVRSAAKARGEIKAKYWAQASGGGHAQLKRKTNHAKTPTNHQGYSNRLH